MTVPELRPVVWLDLYAWMRQQRREPVTVLLRVGPGVVVAFELAPMRN